MIKNKALLGTATGGGLAIGALVMPHIPCVLLLSGLAAAMPAVVAKGFLYAPPVLALVAGGLLLYYAQSPDNKECCTVKHRALGAFSAALIGLSAMAIYNFVKTDIPLQVLENYRTFGGSLADWCGPNRPS